MEDRNSLITHYVLGLVFNHERDAVLLIRKSKPAWQAGLLNGIGGKVEVGECPSCALVREFREETGVDTADLPWRNFCRMTSPHFEVECFTLVDSATFDSAQTREVEEIVRVQRSELSADECISNLPWLIALALDENHGKATPFAVVEYAA